MQLTSNIYNAFFNVTPSDKDQLNCRGIYIGGDGNIALATTVDGLSVVLLGVKAGTILPIALDGGRIMATGTTATAIVTLQ